MQARYLPRTIHEPTHIDVYNNRVTLYSVLPNQEAIITMIENKQLASAFKEYFELLWDLCK